MEGAAQQNPAEDFSVIEDFFAKVKKGDLDKEIWQAAEIICRKDRVFYIGMGTSGTMGKYGARYLSNYGKYAMYVDDPFYPTDDNFYENTVVVVMSVSGEQRFLFKQVQGLKRVVLPLSALRIQKNAGLRKRRITAWHILLAFALPIWWILMRFGDIEGARRVMGRKSKSLTGIWESY